MKLYYNTEILKWTIFKENRHKSGVYQWVNNITGKSYIGSSINLSGRFSGYYSKRHLNRTTNGASVISRAILKYGHFNFSLVILEYCEPSVLLLREQYYMDILKPEYNILKLAGTRKGVKYTPERIARMKCVKLKFTPEWKLNMSIAAKGRKHTAETIKKIRATTSKNHGICVEVLDISNNFIKILPSKVEAALYSNVSTKTISKHLDKNKICKGFIFKSGRY